MFKRKSSKKKYSQDRQDVSKRRSLESQTENSRDDLDDPELDRIGSDIEEGGLDLSKPFRPIPDFIGNRKELLEQCFHVLGEKKLRKMLPDELKDCSLQEIKALCWEHVQTFSDKNLLQILRGEDVVSEDEDTKVTSESQQDNNIDSTSCCKDTKNEEQKQEGAGFGEESDVLSINVEAYDSDIEGDKEELAPKAAATTSKQTQIEGESSEGDQNLKSKNTQHKKDIQSDIDKSVSEILAISASTKEEANKLSGQEKSADVGSTSHGGHLGCESQPSVQQLALLELEMRARAIKALMKASDGN